MKIGEKKDQRLFEEAQADAIRLRKERDDAHGWLRVIGRISHEEGTIERCRAALRSACDPAAAEARAADTARLDWLQKHCADLELTCGGLWRVAAMFGDYEADDPRAAIDLAMAGEGIPA